MYDNVYLDFGEVIPMLSKDGQKSIIKEMLEITPFNKLLWSSDGHWFPETFYLGSLQTREVVHEVNNVLCHNFQSIR
jgi:predicted TIM-barrel fold metal-dependent hydrolase